MTGHLITTADSLDSEHLQERLDQNLVRRNLEANFQNGTFVQVLTGKERQPPLGKIFQAGCIALAVCPNRSKIIEYNIIAINR